MPHEERSIDPAPDDDVSLFVPAAKSDQPITDSKTVVNNPFDFTRSGHSSRAPKSQRADGVHRSRGALMGLILTRILLVLVPLSVIGLLSWFIAGVLVSHQRTNTALSPGASPAAGSATPAPTPPATATPSATMTPSATLTPSSALTETPAVVTSTLDARLDRPGSVLTLTQSLTLTAPVSSFDLSVPDTSRLKAALPGLTLNVTQLAATIDGAAATVSATASGWHLQAASPGTRITVAYSLLGGVVRVTPAPKGRVLAVVAGLVPTAVGKGVYGPRLTVQDSRVRTVTCIAGASSTVCGERSGAAWTANLNDPAVPLALLQVDLTA